MTANEHRLRGRYFEEFQVGERWATPGRTVAEADLVAFSGLSGDFNELHSNEEYARQTPFGKRIAHGLLGLAIASGLASRMGFMEGTAQALMGVEWKFKAPIFIGDTVSLRASVAQMRELKRLGGGLLIFDVALWNQDGKVVQEGKWTILMKSRVAEAQAGR